MLTTFNQVSRRIMSPELFAKTHYQKWMGDEFEENLVSIVIPTYNRSQFLNESIESIWKQNYRPIEVIIVDDGSTDTTDLVIEAWRKKISNSCGFTIRYFYQSRLGAQVARNLGLLESKGEYIQFLDSDDVLISTKLAWAIEALSNSDADLAYFKTQEVDENLNHIIGSIWGKSGKEWHNNVVDYLWHTSGPVYRRNVIKEIGPWLETLSGSQDWEYGARIKLCNYKSIYDERIGSLFRRHTQERISVSDFNYKYTQSAELAYDYIVHLAEELGLMNELLGNRFIRLYLTRALEYHTAKYYTERDRCFSKALALPSSKNIVWFITYICHLLPNQLILNLINKLLVIRRKTK